MRSAATQKGELNFSFFLVFFILFLFQSNQSFYSFESKMGESRTELLAWVNDLLQLNYTKVEQTGTGTGLFLFYKSTKKKGTDNSF